MSLGSPPIARAADQRGSVVVLFALLLPVLLLVLALAIDVGNWFVHRRHLQMQADAAALAGGAYYGDCFLGRGISRIQDEATKYAGNSASLFNLQIDGGYPRVTTLFNSKTFAVGGPPPDDTAEDSCAAPYMFDVKQTEQDVPYILGSLIDWIVPGSSTVVPAINARARVQLKMATILRGSLPLAVPDVNPRYVTATFVDETAGGTLLAGPVPLTKGAASGGLNYWSGSGSVTVPADAKVGVRIGLGGQSGPCAAANGTGGTGYVCYDYDDSTIGLGAIDGYGSGGTVDKPKPHVWATTSCTGSPFFSDVATAPATTCGVSVQAVMQTGSGAVDPAKKKVFKAILDGAGLTNVAAAFTYDPGNGYWSTGYAFDVPAQGGPVDVSLQWQSTNSGAKLQTYSNIQRVYSGSDDSSGPVKALSLSSSTSTVGSPYALAAGTHTISVDVGLEGSLNLTDTTKTTMLRLTGGSRTSAVACDGTGANEFRNSIVNGCQTPYQLNPVGYCPDPSPPAGPGDCVPTQTGEMAGPTLQALDERFASCPSNNWSTGFDETSDPRVVKLMITDFSALGGNGTTDVPVMNFATFYITGWTGSKCSNNDPPPSVVKKGAIWGHFFKYVAPDPFSGGTQDCDPQALTPCIPVLVK